MHVVLNFNLTIFDVVTAHAVLDTVPTTSSTFMTGQT